MVDNIVLLNSDKSKEVIVSTSSRNYVLDEVDWDMPEIELSSFKVPFQIGETLKGVKVGVRKPTISGYIVADTSKMKPLGMGWNEYLQAQKEEIEEKKESLNNVISIYNNVLIRVGSFELIARPSRPPKYSLKESENNEIMCYFSLEFVCFKPLFYSGTKSVILAHTTPRFRFPFVIPPEKFIFGEVIRRRTIMIENNGDIDVGCTITIYADGGIVKNPKIYNVRSGEYIEFEDVTLQDGDSVTITTEKTEESVTKHDVNTLNDETLIGDLKTGSSFLQIRRGSNYYAYSVDDEYINNINVAIEFTERYFNIKEM